MMSQSVKKTKTIGGTKRGSRMERATCQSLGQIVLSFYRQD